MNQVVIRPCECEEALEHFLGEHTFRVFGALIAHKTVDERVRCRLHDHTGEGCVEEVGVLFNALLESLDAEVGEHTQTIV